MKENTKNRLKLKDAKCMMSATATKIDRKICINNCTHYNRQKRECKLGYNFKPKR